jgi:hypothetical protein
MPSIQPMLNDILSGKLSLAFPNVTITQLESRKERPLEVYSGTAQVNLDDKGQLRLQFLTQTNLSIDRVFPILEVEPGDLIPKSMMFRFEGMETDGRKWICEEFIPNFSSGPGGASATGKFAALSSPQQVSFKREKSTSTVTSYFRVKPSFWAIPWAAIPEVNLKHPQYQIVKKGLSFDGIGWRLALAADEAWFSSHAECAPNQVSNGFADKVVRALEFWLGRHLEAIYEVLEDGDKRTTTLYSSRVRQFENTYAPVSEHSPDALNDSLRLLTLFLNRLVKDAKSDWPPIVIYTRMATASMEGALDLMALVLGVSVEGLVRAEFPMTKRPVTDDMSNDIDALSKLVREGNFTADFKKRAPGAIGNLRSTGPRDVLLVLEGSNSLPAGSEKAWSNLRNKAAHPIATGTVSQPEIDQLYQECRSVLVLLYRLVFLVLQYQGSYADYSAKGWPDTAWTRTIPSRSLPH